MVSCFYNQWSRDVVGQSVHVLRKSRDFVLKFSKCAAEINKQTERHNGMSERGTWLISIRVREHTFHSRRCCRGERRLAVPSWLCFFSFFGGGLASLAYWSLGVGQVDKRRWCHDVDCDAPAPTTPHAANSIRFSSLYIFFSLSLFLSLFFSVGSCVIFLCLKRRIVCPHFSASADGATVSCPVFSACEYQPTSPIVFLPDRPTSCVRSGWIWSLTDGRVVTCNFSKSNDR